MTPEFPRLLKTGLAMLALAGTMTLSSQPPTLAQTALPIVTVQAGGIVPLAPPPADPTTPDEVTIQARPVATLRGKSNWDDGYETLTKAFTTLTGALGKAGIKATGAPIAQFLATDDDGFRFEAQIPIEAAPAARPAGLPADVNFGSTISGRAYRFVHRAPYDDLDSTYEAIAAYLDSKGIEAKETFTEEYMNTGTDAGDSALDLNIYVQPK